jgi:YegS/Rv2252/BmrU family lipid kinase
MKILIVGNPIASRGGVESKISRLTAVLEHRGHRVESYLTRFAGDGRRYIATAAAAFDRIVVVGGDGTFNEVLNGIPGDIEVPLLQLPTGNANLLARDLSLQRTVAGAAHLLEHGRVIRADTADMNGVRFIMVAGVGFDARVTEELKKVRKGRAGNLSYVIPIFRALRSRSGSPLTVTVDREQTAAAAVLICNVRSYGGICEIAFDAGIDTRRLDIVVLPEEGLWPFAKVFAMARISRVTRLQGVRYFQGATVRITGNNPIPVQVDGDFAGRYPEIDISLQPASLPLVVP